MHSSAFEDTALIGIWDGATFGDIDNDGDLDLFITNWEADPLPEERNYLYRNDNGTFVDVTVSSGLDTFHELSLRATFLDIDNDGDQDVFIAGENENGKQYVQLFSNNKIVTSVSDDAASTDLDFLIYPNPVESNHLTVSHNSIVDDAIKVEVLDITGPLLLKKSMSVRAV